MKIFICCSKYNYHHIHNIKEALEKIGHVITLPNSFDKPMCEEEMKTKGEKSHADWKAKKLKEQLEKIKDNEALLILNFDKGDKTNYIGGATFLEMYEAFKLEKKIFLYNPLSESILSDEIRAFKPIIINGDLKKILI